MICANLIFVMPRTVAVNAAHCARMNVATCWAVAIPVNYKLGRNEERNVIAYTISNRHV